MRAVYEANLVEDTDSLELPIYDAERDARGTRSQPCLSHLSFKLLPGDRVMLTVLYRYHYYICLPVEQPGLGPSAMGWRLSALRT